MGRGRTTSETPASCPKHPAGVLRTKEQAARRVCVNGAFQGLGPQICQHGKTEKIEISADRPGCEEAGGTPTPPPLKRTGGGYSRTPRRCSLPSAEPRQSAPEAEAIPSSTQSPRAPDPAAPPHYRRALAPIRQRPGEILSLGVCVCAGGHSGASCNLARNPNQGKSHRRRVALQRCRSWAE